MLRKRDSHKTCLVMTDGGDVLEQWLDFDAPGVAVGADWMLVVMNANGVGTLRHRVGKRG